MAVCRRSRDPECLMRVLGYWATYRHVGRFSDADTDIQTLVRHQHIFIQRIYADLMTYTIQVCISNRIPMGPILHQGQYIGPLPQNLHPDQVSLCSIRHGRFCYDPDNRSHLCQRM
jgi:hypothetical protein